MLFTASIRSRQEIEALAAEARRLRSDVKISIRAAQGQGVIRGSWSSICRNRRCDLRGGGGGSGEELPPRAGQHEIDAAAAALRALEPLDPIDDRQLGAVASRLRGQVGPRPGPRTTLSRCPSSNSSPVARGQVGRSGGNEINPRTSDKQDCSL